MWFRPVVDLPFILSRMFESAWEFAHPHVFCGLVTGIRPHPCESPVGGASGAWGVGPLAMSHLVPVK